MYMEHVAIALLFTNSFNTLTEISSTISWKPWHPDTIKNHYLSLQSRVTNDK